MVKKVNLLTDVVGLLMDTTNPKNLKNNYLSKRPREKSYNRSLRGKAGDFILQFPLVTSDIIDPDTIELMRNQLELERAFEFDFILSNTPLQNYNPGDPSSFMANLHNNVNLRESSNNEIRKANKYLLESPEDKMNMGSINDMTITKEENDLLNEDTMSYQDKLVNATITIDFDGPEVVKAFQGKSMHYKARITVNYSNGDTKIFDYSDLKDDELAGIAEGIYEIEDDHGELFEHGNRILAQKLNDAVEEIEASQRKEIYKNFGAVNTKVNSDKINGSLPTTIITTVKFREMDSKGRPVSNVVVDKPVKFGVKTVVHPVKTEDIIFYLSDKSKSSNLVTKLVKFTTGEIRLFKDILFNVDRAKKIARDTKRGRSGSIWRKLNALYTVDRTSSLARSSSGSYIPTTSLMITVDEANEVRKQTGVDLLSDRRAANKIYKEFFLLDFIIIDQARDILYKYLPEHNKFEVVKLSKLGAVKVKNDRDKDKLDSKLLEKLLRR